MKKKLSLIFLSVVMLLSLTACGGSSKDVSVDVNKLCQDLKATVTSGDLADVASDRLESTYFLDMSKVEESAAALNSGANACEVAVIKCSDSSYASEAQKLFENRIKSQSDLFAGYNPPEVAKLDAAILKTAGSYVVYCVTDDTAKAEEIVKAAGF